MPHTDHVGPEHAQPAVILASEAITDNGLLRHNVTESDCLSANRRPSVFRIGTQLLHRRSPRVRTPYLALDGRSRATQTQLRSAVGGTYSHGGGHLGRPGDPVESPSQLSETLAVSGGQRNASASACEGVLKPRVCRGRPFSSAAIASRAGWSSWRRSALLGRYWRSRPLVFSLLPRCQGLRGSQKYTWTPVVDRELGVLGHLLALIPGQRPPELLGQPSNGSSEGGADLLSPVPLGQRDQGEVAAGPLHQRRHCRWPLAQQQVAFPVARHRPVARPPPGAR